ncbi:uncharacterized protein BDV17DRAFT_60978 [Aspergillus undulatus]|uniref:uncharacterized protein n=1 Tax=Aspergillus undulatus TaxID=1810928 RepID=UPI003CCCDE51
MPVIVRAHPLFAIGVSPGFGGAVMLYCLVPLWFKVTNLAFIGLFSGFVHFWLLHIVLPGVLGRGKVRYWFLTLADPGTIL